MKRIVCIVAVVLTVLFVVSSVVLSAHALDSQTLNFTVSINDSPSGSLQGQYVNFYVKGVNGGTQYTYGPYHNNQSSVITSDFFTVMTLEGDENIPPELGYTGCVIHVYSQGYATDLTASVLGVTPINGEYYVDFGVDVSLNNTNDGQPMIFVLDAINWPQHLDNTSGYQRGLEEGKTLGYSKCYHEKYEPLKDQYDILYQSYLDALEAAGQDVADQISLEQFEAAVQAASQEGYQRGLGDADVVGKTLYGSITSTGNVVTQFLSFPLLGVPIYVILATIGMIPLTLFLIKLLFKG